MNRLQDKYQTSVKAELTNKFNYKSSMQIPKLEKIVINMGVGDAVANSKVLDDALEELTQIAGQKPVVTKAKKSIANFKLREGMPIGCKVTLRGEKMYEFFDKLVSIALPRVRDFHGVNANKVRPSSSVFAVVTITISIPRIFLILSKLISGKINCSLTPRV